jgi:Protein of unknown function (DUF2726)
MMPASTTLASSQPRWGDQKAPITATPETSQNPFRHLVGRGTVRKREQEVAGRTCHSPSKSPITDPAEQLRLVMGARFERRRLLSRSEAHVLYAAERAINIADLKWRVMAQVSLGEVLSSPDARAYSAINSKRVDLLIVSRSGDPIAAIEYQGHGHYQGTAAARDAVKKEALRKAGVGYIAVTPEGGTEDMAREISRIAQAERLSPDTSLRDGDRETPSKERGTLKAWIRSRRA